VEKAHDDSRCKWLHTTHHWLLLAYGYLLKSANVINRLRNSNAVKFILFKEDKPKHRVFENLSPLHALAAFYLSLFLGAFGFVVFVHTSIIGFVAYYVVVAIAVLEALHYLCDR